MLYRSLCCAYVDQIPAGMMILTLAGNPCVNIDGYR